MSSRQPRTSLYVGDLHLDVTSAFLFEVFKDTGTLIGTHVCRDPVTRESLGYGYVDFQVEADAERALAELNFTRINDIEMQIIRKCDREIKTRAICIKNLSSEISGKALFDTLVAFGDVISARARHSPGRSSGYGIVQFREESAASDCIGRLDGMLMNGLKVSVDWQRESQKKRVQIDDTNFTNCYIQNLSPGLTDQIFRETLSRFGEFRSATIMKNSTGVSRGFGFCDFLNHEAAVRAVAGLNGSTDSRLAAEEGPPLSCSRAMGKSERRRFLIQKFQRGERGFSETNVYVKHLDESVDDVDLRRMFAPFGQITSARVMRDQASQVSKGFGFVNFSTAEEAASAIVGLNGRIFGPRPLYCAIAQPKAIRREQLRQRFSSPPRMPFS